ncbi:cell division protein FtsA [bacterium]|nr:cell division protein FtsA [bacterium]
MKKSEILVGLDLGSSRIKVVVADVSDRDLPEILGIGESASAGIEAGVIVNMEKAAEAIREAFVEAEASAEVEIGSAAIAINGEHIRGIDSRGVIAVSRSGGEITRSEISTVMEAAQTLALPVGRTVVDALPQEFFVDGQRGIRDPIGMTGVRLGSQVHIVTAEEHAVDSARRAVRKAGVRESGIYVKPIAAALSSLSEDETELGSLSINMGAGSTGIVLYHGRAVRHVAVVEWGGACITNDIAVGLRIPVSKAEQLKREVGCASASATADRTVEIPSIGGQEPRQSSTQVLAAIIEPRVREIFEMLRDEVRSTEFSGRTPAGVIITGGGAKLDGITQVAEDIFGVPARIGLPDRVSGVFDAIADPSHAAAVGIIIAASRVTKRRRRRRDGRVNETVNRVKQWVDSLL